MILLALLAAPALQTSVGVSAPTKLVPPISGSTGLFGRGVATRDGALAIVGAGGPAAMYSEVSGGWNFDGSVALSPFGPVVAIEGDWMIRADPFGDLMGIAEAARRINGTWTTVQSLAHPDYGGSFEEHYGWSVAVDGTRLAIGNPTDGNSPSGRVYIWELSGSAWQRTAAVSAPGQRTGTGVALHGDELLTATRTAVHHFHFDSNARTWNYVGQVLGGMAGGPNGAIPNHHPLAISREGVVVVGDPLQSLLGANAGMAYVLERDGASWRHSATLQSASPTPMATFGASVAARGSVLAVGAPDASSNSGLGYVELFTRNNGWQHAARFTASDATVSVQYGFSVALDAPPSGLSETLVVGAPPYSGFGAAYVYTLQHPSARVHCVPKANSQDCLPRAGFDGTPSVSSSSPFTLSCSSAINQRNGVCFYGTSGPSAAPFKGGLKCVSSPTRRVGGTLQSGGSAPNVVDCSGVFSLDFNAWIQAGVDLALVPGAVVNAQFWYRDGAASFGVGLSDAIEFGIEP